MPPHEAQLLADYATTRSQESFSAIVERYVDLVYSAARRQCRGDAHLAEDVTQAVFIILADKADKVPPDRPLSAWLLKTTSYCAANARRSKSHRLNYERRAAEMARAKKSNEAEESAWDELSPLLDEGMNKLRPQDRDALLLKFFEKKSLRQIGEAFGISEEAAGKRVARAVERLRDYFRRRGVAVTAAALPAMLLANASQAAPLGMASAVVTTTTTTAAAAAATTSGASAVAKGALAVMAAEKAKAVAVAAAAIVLGVGASAVVVKTVVSPVANRNRQVNVAAAAQPATLQPATTATTAPAANAWPVRFPGGAVIEVLGVREHSAPEPMRLGWWTLNGMKVPPPGTFEQSLVSVPHEPGTRTIQVMLRFRDVPPTATRVVLLRPNVSGGTTATRIGGAGSGNGEGGITQHVTRVPENQQTADLVLGIGDGPWETYATYDARTSKLTPSPTASTRPGDTPTIAGVTQEGAMVIVRSTLQRRARMLNSSAGVAGASGASGASDAAGVAGVPDDLRDEQIVAVTDTGELRPQMTRLVDGNAEFHFKVPLSRVRSIVWRSRPLSVVEVSNVSLRRMQLTDVRVRDATRLPSRTTAVAR